MYVADLAKVGRLDRDRFRWRLYELLKIFHAHFGLVIYSDHRAKLLHGVKNEKGKEHECDEVAHQDHFPENKTIKTENKSGSHQVNGGALDKTEGTNKT